MNGQRKKNLWIAVRDNEGWKCDLSSIEDDLIDPNTTVTRKVTVNADTDDKYEHDLKIIRSIPYKLWIKFAEWGAESGELSLNLQSKAKEIANDLKYNHKLIPDNSFSWNGHFRQSMRRKLRTLGRD